MLPLRHKDNAPDHNDKGIDEIGRTVLSCIVEHIVPNRCQHTDKSRKNQPFLKEGHKCEVSLRVGAKIFFEIPQHDSSIL